MCQGELPDYFKQYALNRNITISLNKADEEVIKSASTKLDYLAFSYYRSSVQASFDEIDDVITLDLISAILKILIIKQMSGAGKLIHRDYDIR